MERKRLISLALALLTALLLSACGGARDEICIIRVGHSDTTANPLQANLERFSRAVNLRTKGRVEVQIYPAEQLGTNDEMFAQVEDGALDAMILPAGQQAIHACPKLAVLGLPFLFSDYDHVYRVLDSEIGAELLEGMEDHNMIQIAWWENGLRQLTNSVRPIETPEDLVGLRFRTPPDRMTETIFACFGATTGTLELSEVYTALQIHEFDGQENPVANIFANNFQNVQKYLTMLNYQYQPKAFVFSLSTWKKLPSDVRAVLREAAHEFGNMDRREIREDEAVQLEEIRAAGVEIGYPDPAPFIEKAQEVYEQFYQQEPWARGLVDRIEALRESGE